MSTRSCRTKGATRTLNSRSSGHRVIIRGYHTASMIYISRLTNNNIGDVLDGESNIVARCVSICIRRPNKCCPVHQDTQVRRSTVVPCRLNDRDRMSIMERHPHNCPLRQPPVIPLIGTTQWKRGHPSNVGVEGFPRHDETWPGTRRWRQPRTKKWALHCTCNDRHIHEHQRPAPDRNKLY